MRKQTKRYWSFATLLAASLLPALAQVSSENYVQTSTRISDTQMQSVTQYYDGLGRPTERVEHGVTPGRENLVHLQEFDGLGRDWRSWLPVKTSSSFLGRSDVAFLSQSQYSDSHAYSASVYDGSPLNRIVRVDGVGEDWSEHPVRTDFLINTTKEPLNCVCYRVSMSGELEYKGYYPEGRLKITKTTDEDGHESYEFKNLSDRVVLRRTMLSEKESADTYYIYDYNLRSWPTSISSGMFTQKLAYNVSNGSLFPMKGIYNGNISSMSWQVGDGVQKGYFFRYNNQNMLTDAIYREGGSFAEAADHYSEHLEYDLVGNVDYLKRYGLLDDGSYGLVYDAEGSKLSVSYNLTAMTSAQPQMPVMQSQDVASANQEQEIRTMDYCGNIVYYNDCVTILNDVGYVEYDDDDFLSYYYYLRDHLGNNRVVLDASGNIMQVNDYYATGGLMGSSKEDECQRYKYNGKELDRTHGLDWYDYGARNYDAALVVWNGVDELSEKYYPFSVYGYCQSNFMNALDKDGKDVVVLLAPRGAGGAGHMAILIQNPDGRWALWSKNGTPDNMHAFGKEGDADKYPEYHNNRGGSLDGNESSYQTVEDFFNSEDNPKKDGIPEYTEGYKMSTTKEQDEKARAAIGEELNKDYDVLSSNCAQAVQAALKAAGLNPGKGLLPKKQVYPSITKNNLGRFQMFYNMSKRKYYKYKK